MRHRRRLLPRLALRPERELAEAAVLYLSARRPQSQPPTRGAGADVATLLAGAWHRSPAPLELSAAELARMLCASRAQLLGSACGALVWWRLRASPHASLAAARPFRDAYRHHAISGAVHAHRLALVARALAAAGVEALLVKGWATSRLYPEPGLRPPGDVDLFVAPDARPAAGAALADPSLALVAADLHTSLPDLRDRAADELFARSALVPITGGPAGGGEPALVRVLAPEDHLRQSALHLLRHGAWRPLWLCDIGLLIDRLPEAFDWDLCLRGRREDARRVAVAVTLAHRLLGATIPSALAREARGMPRWIVAATQRQWSKLCERYSDPPLSTQLRRPAQLLDALRRRWPNPIEATVSLDAPFNALPRLPIQLGDVAWRALRTCGSAIPKARPSVTR